MHANNYREMLRKRMLTYGLAVSIVGLPAGILLGMPALSLLALLGIVVGGLKLLSQSR